MGSRFAQSFHIDFCYNPVRISKNGLVMYVPCGKCNGCLLQKANTWSFRLGDEIECSSNAIFFTLTYDNDHVPKMRCNVENGRYHWFSCSGNVRYNGKTDVYREALDFYSPYTLRAPLKNYKDKDVVGYLCKSDLQLYFKLLRKKIYDKFGISTGSFRYYVVGEYGPGKDANRGKFRPHYHCIIFPCNSEVASFLMESALFESWKMCDRTLFTDYSKYCDSGARHYVTEYVTGITYLPPLLSKTEEIRPFFLASKKNGCIGSVRFNAKKVCEDIERRVDQYTKEVSRIERNYIFFYPSSVINSLFPKCSRFRLLSFDGLLRVYGYLYEFRQAGFENLPVFDKPDRFSTQDYQASKACKRVCDLMNWSPFHYVEVLVEYYYRKEQRALRYQYEFQQKNISNPYLCMSFYSNFTEIVLDHDYSCNFPSLSRMSELCRQFILSFGLDPYTEFNYGTFLSYSNNCDYESEVDSIISFADKSKKVNSVSGLSPHIV